MTDLGGALRAAIWAQALEPRELVRVEAEMSERAVPAGGYVCRKGEPVNHWIGVIDGLLKLGTVSESGATFARLLDTSIAFNRFLLNQLNERLAQFIAMPFFTRGWARSCRCRRRRSATFRAFHASA